MRLAASSDPKPGGRRSISTSSTIGREAGLSSSSSTSRAARRTRRPLVPGDEDPRDREAAPRRRRVSRNELLLLYSQSRSKLDLDSRPRSELSTKELEEINQRPTPLPSWHICQEHRRIYITKCTGCCDVLASAPNGSDARATFRKLSPKKYRYRAYKTR